MADMPERESWRHEDHLLQLALAAGTHPDALLDFSTSSNPLGPPEWLRARISAAVSSLVRCPDPDCSALIDAAAQQYGVPAEQILAGNGTTELLYLLPAALDIGRAFIPLPAPEHYLGAARAGGVTAHLLPLHAENDFDLDFDHLAQTLRHAQATAAMVLLGRPNHLTGRSFDADRLRRLAQRFANVTFVVDETSAEFIEDFDSLTVNRPANVLVLRSVTRAFACPGLRLGLAIGDAAAIRGIKAMQPPRSVNTIALAVGEAALQDGAYLEQSRAHTGRLRDYLHRRLGQIHGLTVFPGQANFLLVRCNRAGLDAPSLARRLLKHGLAIRVCDGVEGLDQRFFRLAVRDARENHRLLDALRKELFMAPLVTARRRTPALMLQGTASGAGKSVLTAALCRIMLQDGYRIAPFKAQTMPRAPYVTRDGGQMGRGQAMQALAARLDPDVRMNPLLLKPDGAAGDQVVMCGRPVEDLRVTDYVRYRAEAFERIKEAYDALAGECDAVLLEGTGSPAEVNLKTHDIVNMKMAEHAEAPVLLVGDIDRGGVFASFVGSMEVLNEQERARVAGFIVNRFRGRADMLKEALDYTLHHTGRPVLGVVPYLDDLGLPREHAAEQAPQVGKQHPINDSVDIAVIALPHAQGLSDGEPLRLEPDVRLRIIAQARQLGSPDAIILPHSRDLLGDLTFLRASGLDRRLIQLAGQGGTEIVGIGAGFQLLGRSIADPHGLAIPGAAMDALGLLPMTTAMASARNLTPMTARHLASGLSVSGYAVPHDSNRDCEAIPALLDRQGQADGACSANGQVWGCYLLGLFDADPFRRWFIDRLRRRKGLSPLQAVQMRYDLEPAFERLADTVRACLDMPAIYRLMGLR
jgi:cobyric acid synthase CobQ